MPPHAVKAGYAPVPLTAQPAITCTQISFSRLSSIFELCSVCTTKVYKYPDRLLHLVTFNSQAYPSMLLTCLYFIMVCHFNWLQL